MPLFFLKIMANENLDDWQATTTVINESVRVAKEFLDKEIRKHKSFKHFQKRSQEFLTTLLATEGEFHSVRGKGIGERTIRKFLGGNFTQHKVREALEGR